MYRDGERKTCLVSNIWWNFKEVEHVPNIFMSFDRYLVLEVINILI